MSQKSVFSYPVSWLRQGGMVQIDFNNGDGVIGYFASVHKGRIGIYEDPLEVESFVSFPLKNVTIRRLS